MSTYFELKQDTRIGEQWGVSCELLQANILQYIRSAHYFPTFASFEHVPDF